MLSSKFWRAGLLATFAGLGATACATTATPSLSVPLMTATETNAPAGFLNFCLTDPSACGANTALPMRPQVEMTEELWAVVLRINREANHAIRYVSDQASGRQDVWTVATTTGDCEDYALAKRAALMDIGLPQSALRLATVYSRRTGYHAVLVVSTTNGDYVLDNTRDAVLPWTQTEFAWVSVQSADNPMQWHRVASRSSDMADLSMVATAGG